MDPLAALLLRFKSLRPLRRVLARPFRGHRSRRLLIVYQPLSVTEAQVFPFAYHAGALAQHYDAEIRFIETGDLLKGVPEGLRGADAVAFQSWLTDPPERLEALVTTIGAVFPAARKTYLDGFANTDLRFARLLSDRVDAYAKKSLFRDRRQFLRPTRGDTNLVDYYSRLYGLPAAPVDWQVPEAILGKLHLTPNFFTAARFLPALGTRSVPDRDGRGIDVHARLATGAHEGGWYAHMRQDFLDRLTAISGLSVQTGTGVAWAAYMRELRRSKICASPFGFGEVCWRDIEAIVAGAVLLKPDMGHLDTLPDLYRPWETYAPVAWDFSDLADVVARLLDDADLRARLTATAFEAVRSYVQAGRFVADTGYIFG